MFFVTVDIIQHKSYKVNRITIDLTFLLKYALIFMGGAEMKISTKVECGIIAIADIAMNSENGETVTVYSVAERRGLSGKYLEQVLTSLRQARLIKGIKGSRGGYILNKKPEKITLKEIIDALDPSVLGSDVAVVNDENTEFAQVLDDYIWLRLENKLKSYTESITLRQLVDFYNKESAENVSEPMYYI